MKVKHYLIINQSLILILLTSIVLVGFSDEISAKFASKDWAIGSFYAAIFDWSSILSAFMFGVYAFVLGRSQPFVDAVSNTRAFEQARNYIRHTVYIMLLITALCIPMLVASPMPTDGGYTDIGYVFFSTYTLVTVYLFSRFWKIVRVFRKPEGAND